MAITGALPDVLSGGSLRVCHDRTTSARATAAGNACTQSIFRLAVIAPNTPATITQARKKILTGFPAAPSKRPHTSPAARNPLYNPWLAASVFEAAANSGVSPKVLRPSGLVQRNISRTRKYKCRKATSATAASERVLMGLCAPFGSMRGLGVDWVV